MSAASDTTAYREAIGSFTTGVTVVTSVGDNGPSGLTASAICSLSMDPMLMLVCLDRGSRTLRAIEQSRRLGVNVLGRHQAHVARAFADKGPEHEKFSGIAWSDRAGLPQLDGAVAWLAGDVAELLPGGDHLIAVTAITDVAAPGGDPLVYFRGRFRGLDAGRPGG